MSKLLIALTLAAVAALAQDTPPPPAPTASITGVVRDADAGKGLPDVKVYVTTQDRKEVGTTTDSGGRYTLRGLDAGQYRVNADPPSPEGFRGFIGSANRSVVLSAGQELTGVNFRLALPGEIAGKVVDQNKEPVPGLGILLVAREYSYGALRYVFASAATTDDQGSYLLQRVMPGRAYLVLAQRSAKQMDPISEAPEARALRRPAVMPTYYPNAAAPQGAQAVSLRSAEHREGVDIRLVRTPSFCVDGTTEGINGPASLDFGMAEREPSSGASGNGAMYMGTPYGRSGADGKLRICDLHPGEYELTVRQSSPGGEFRTAAFGSTLVTITDDDVHKVHVATRPRIPVSGEVVWDGAVPAEPVTTKLALNLNAMTRTEYPDAQAPIPGEFTFEGGMPMDDYRIDVRRVPKGMYVKDIRYGNQSVLREPLRVGTAMGDATLRVTLARDGGTISVKVADGDSNPVADCAVVVMPATAASEAAFAAALISGKSDQSGVWTSASIAPGKYYVLATEDIIDKSPETIGKLYRVRASRGQEVELAPNGTPTVSLTVKTLD